MIPPPLLMIPPPLLIPIYCRTNLSSSHRSHTTKSWEWKSLRDFGFHDFQDETLYFSLPLLSVLQSSLIPAAVFPCLTLLCRGKRKYFQILVLLLNQALESSETSLDGDKEMFMVPHWNPRLDGATQPLQFLPSSTSEQLP